MTAVEDLERLLPMPPSIPPTVVDWTATEQQIGTVLPTDYKRLVESYGEAEFSSNVRLSTPNSTAPSLDLTWWTGAARERLGNPDFPPQCDHVPNGFGLDAQSLTPWGKLGGGGYCLWYMSGTNPNEWPVVIGSETHTRWGFFEGTASEFLLALLTQNLPHGRLFDELMDIVEENGVYCDIFRHGAKTASIEATRPTPQE